MEPARAPPLDPAGAPPQTPPRGAAPLDSPPGLRPGPAGGNDFPRTPSIAANVMPQQNARRTECHAIAEMLICGALCRKRKGLICFRFPSLKKIPATPGETLIFFVWLGASLFLRGAGLFWPAPLKKRRATTPDGKNQRFPKRMTSRASDQGNSRQEGVGMREGMTERVWPGASREPACKRTAMGVPESAAWRTDLGE